MEAPPEVYEQLEEEREDNRTLLKYLGVAAAMIIVLAVALAYIFLISIVLK